MNFQAFLTADIAIQIHMVLAIFALVLGALILWRRKGTRIHKLGGKVWVALMVGVSLSSFFIAEIKLWGDFSPIHLISVFTLLSLPIAIVAARRGQISVHSNMMRGTYIGGLIVAGALTFLPGRLNYRIFLGDNFTALQANDGWVIGISSAVAVGAYVFYSIRRGKSLRGQ